MECVVAAFTAGVGFLMPKLCVVMETKLKECREIKADVRIIKDDLEGIEAAIGPRNSNPKHAVVQKQLRRLKYEIEDCIELFDAKKMSVSDFAEEIVQFKKILVETNIRQTWTAEGQGAAPLPIELQNLSDYNLYCLLYLCLFPREYYVRTKPLARRWLAEGLVSKEQDAVNKLEELTNSNWINSIKRSNNGMLKICEPSAEKLEVIAQGSLTEKFILVCDGRDTDQLQKEEPRRLSVQSANVQLNLPEDLSRVRTLAVFPAEGATILASYEDLGFAKYKVLRVLDLKECANMSEDHIQAICKQVLMKYLSINLGSIHSRGREIRHLYQLETLDLSGNEVVTVHEEVLLLPKLRRLLGKLQLSTESYTFHLKWRLKKFLRDKSVLETMAGFVTGGRPGFPELMMRMRALRRVKIWFESNPSQENLDAVSRAITKFIRDGANELDLNRSLSMDFKNCPGQFMDAIGPDVTKKGALDSLKLRGKLSKFPQFVAHLSAVRQVCLRSTGLSWENILQGLNMLGIVQYIELVEDDLGRMDIGDQHLASIERICVVCKTTLDITIRAKALPHLASLHILCQHLQVIPGTPGIEITHMTKLKEVALHPQVEDKVRIPWEHGATCHDKKPVLLFIGEAY